MIPLVHAAELCLACCPYSLLSSQSSFQLVTPRVGKERLSLLEVRECPLLSLPTTAACTPAAPQGTEMGMENIPPEGAGSGWGHSTGETELWRTKGSIGSGLEQHQGLWEAPSLNMHFCAWFVIAPSRCSVPRGGLRASLSDGWCQLSPGRGAKAWALFSCREWDISMAIA